MNEYTTIEDDTSLQVCVDITAGSLERNIEVQLTSMDGSAKGTHIGQFQPVLYETTAHWWSVNRRRFAKKKSVFTL